MHLNFQSFLGTEIACGLIKRHKILTVLRLCLVTCLKSEVALEGAKPLSVNVRVGTFIESDS